MDTFDDVSRRRGEDIRDLESARDETGGDHFGLLDDLVHLLRALLDGLTTVSQMSSNFNTTDDAP
jgi:hypothetical protein